MKRLLLQLSALIPALGAIFGLHGEQDPMKPHVVILMGPPGSGKGTQAVRLSKVLGIPHISTGDLFRENIANKTELGQRAKAYMDAGKLVPDELVLDMLFNRVSQPDSKKGYLLDGFPRTLAQAEALEKHLGTDTKVTVLNLNVNDHVIVERASGRLTCKKGGHVQHRQFSPPRVEGICDVCSGELIQRPDDAPAIVEERLKTYHRQTAPLIHHYEKQGVLIQINGENAPDKVFEDLKKALNK